MQFESIAEITASLRDVSLIFLPSITGILALILIYLFVIGLRLVDIRQQIFRILNPNFYFEYNKNMAFGDLDKAKENLKTLIWEDFLQTRKKYRNTEKILEVMQKLINEKYSKALKNHNMDVPDFSKYI